MAFQKPFTSRIAPISAGNTTDDNAAILSARLFADDLEAGLFVRKDVATGLTKIDGTATPNIVGVALRDMGASFAAELSPNVTQSYSQFVFKGFVTVTVKAGETPAEFTPVFVSNAGDADDGKATATGTDLATSSQFIEELKPATVSTDGVWLVYVA